jgi:hypothetical protein
VGDYKSPKAFLNGFIDGSIRILIARREELLRDMFVASRAGDGPPAHGGWKVNRRLFTSMPRRAHGAAMLLHDIRDDREAEPKSAVSIQRSSW